MSVLSLALRRLRHGDAPSVLAALTSNPDMARQGDVSTFAEAERYVSRLVGSDSPHEPWAIVTDDALVGLVCVSVDDENRSGWFLVLDDGRCSRTRVDRCGCGNHLSVGPDDRRAGASGTRSSGEQPCIWSGGEACGIRERGNRAREVPRGRAADRRGHLREAEIRSFTIVRSCSDDRRIAARLRWSSVPELGRVPVQCLNPWSGTIFMRRIHSFPPERSICHQLVNCLDGPAWILGA